jgi:hypothetical protein
MMNPYRTIQVAGSIVLALVIAACGSDTPSSSTPVPNVTGSWTGTMESSNFDTRAVEVSFTQAGGTVNGDWSHAAADWNGTISGSISGTTFSGTFTFSGPSFTGIGPRCTGNASVSGPVTENAPTVRWTSSGFTGSCSGMPANLVWNLQRR